MSTNSTRTPANPTGITNYDIGAFAQLPEWQTLAQALNDVTRAASRAGIRANQDDLADAVSHLARGVAFMDYCQKCARYDHIADTSAAPYTVTIENGRSLQGRYTCRNGHHWTRSHLLDYMRYF